MASSQSQDETNGLDPRIQVELEKLNTATDDINKLELELEEAKKSFRILSNEATKKSKIALQTLGTSINKARPYYQALQKARDARVHCQKATTKFRLANENHAAAKETLSLAEKQFIENQHQWKFDSAWQEMLNHTIMKVKEAESLKAECEREHQRCAILVHQAEQEAQEFEKNLKRHIAKSRDYFEEKSKSDEQLQAQKERIEALEISVARAKRSYAQALKMLECISDEIHRTRGNGGDGDVKIEDDADDELEPPPGPREPGVGAELEQITVEDCAQKSETFDATIKLNNLEELRKKVHELAIRPIECNTSNCSKDDTWEMELNETINKLDYMYMMREANVKEERLKHKSERGTQSLMNSPLTRRGSGESKSLRTTSTSVSQEIIMNPVNLTETD